MDLHSGDWDFGDNALASNMLRQGAAPKPRSFHILPIMANLGDDAIAFFAEPGN